MMPIDPLIRAVTVRRIDVVCTAHGRAHAADVAGETGDAR
jgi:hypothetical protein